MAHNNVKKNILYQAAYELLILLLPFVTSPYIARTLGAEGVGTFTMAQSIAYYFVIAANLGIATFGNRAIAQVQHDQPKVNTVFTNLLVLHAAISAVVIVLYGIYVAVWSTDKQYAMIMGLYVLSAVLDISWLYFGVEEFKLTVARNTVIKLISILLVFLMIRTREDVWKYCLIYAAGMLISQIALWIPLKKYARLVRPDFQIIKAYIKPMLVLFVPVIAVSIYKHMDKIMIGALSNAVELGLYENAEKATTLPATLISSFGTVMLPKMSNLVATANREAANKYLKVSLRYVLCLAFALAGGFYAVGGVFAPWFWGEEFAKSGTLIELLSISIPFFALANIVRTQILIPNEKDREYLLAVIFGAAANLIMNALFIPNYGAVGATFGTIAAEVIVCAVQCFLIRGQLSIKDYIGDSMVFLVNTLIMIGATRLVSDAGTALLATLLAKILVGIVVYVTLSGIYFIRTKDRLFSAVLTNGKQYLKKRHNR